MAGGILRRGRRGADVRSSVPAGRPGSRERPRNRRGPVGRPEGRARLAPPRRPDVPRRPRRKEPSLVGRSALDHDRRARPRRRRVRPPGRRRRRPPGRDPRRTCPRRRPRPRSTSSSRRTRTSATRWSRAWCRIPTRPRTPSRRRSSPPTATCARYRGPSFRGWLTRIAVNAAMDLQRARKRRPVSPVPGARGRVVAAARRRRHGPRDDRHDVRARPGARRRPAPRSRPTSGPRSCSTTSRATTTPRSPTMTGVSLGTVKSRIHRGRLALRAHPGRADGTVPKLRASERPCRSSRTLPAAEAEDHAALIVALDAGDLAGADARAGRGARRLVRRVRRPRAPISRRSGARWRALPVPRPPARLPARPPRTRPACGPSAWRRLLGWLAAPGSGRPAARHGPGDARRRRAAPDRGPAGLRLRRQRSHPEHRGVARRRLRRPGSPGRGPRSHRWAGTRARQRCPGPQADPAGDRDEPRRRDGHGLVPGTRRRRAMRRPVAPRPRPARRPPRRTRRAPPSRSAWRSPSRSWSRASASSWPARSPGAASPDLPDRRGPGLDSQMARDGGMADAPDSKSGDRKVMGVRISLPGPRRCLVRDAREPSPALRTLRRSGGARASCRPPCGVPR